MGGESRQALELPLYTCVTHTSSTAADEGMHNAAAQCTCKGAPWALHRLSSQYSPVARWIRRSNMTLSCCTSDPPAHRRIKARADATRCMEAGLCQERPMGTETPGLFQLLLCADKQAAYVLSVSHEYRGHTGTAECVRYGCLGHGYTQVLDLVLRCSDWIRNAYAIGAPHKKVEDGVGHVEARLKSTGAHEWHQLSCRWRCQPVADGTPCITVQQSRTEQAEPSRSCRRLSCWHCTSLTPRKVAGCSGFHIPQAP